MHGASNDFILIDDRRRTFPARNRRWIERISARRTGIGCEGVILIQPSRTADFAMRFFNPDGREAEMCGNGARCVARLAHELGIAPARMSFDTRAGLLRAEVKGNRVRLHMSPPRDWRMRGQLRLGGRTVAYHFVNTGVPHCVVPVRNLEMVDVRNVGCGIRHHAAFAPRGTNVNFVVVTGPNSIRIRTYERGVEAETLACGTGITAAALTMARAGKVRPPVKVNAASGDVLTVDFRLIPDGAEHVTLLGPAEHVFQGTLPLPS